MPESRRGLGDFLPGRSRAPSPPEPLPAEFEPYPGAAGASLGEVQEVQEAKRAEQAEQVEQVEEVEGLVDPRYDIDDANWVRYRRSWGGFLRFVAFAVFAVVAVMWVRDRIYDWVDTQVDPAGPQGAAIELTIPSGASVNDVSSVLDSAGVISNATVFRYWLRCSGELTISGFLRCDKESSFQAGDYDLYQNMDFDSVLARLDQGAIPEVIHRVTIPEGLRWGEMARHLVEANPEFDRIDLEVAFVALSTASAFLPADPVVNTMEGLLFPATYNIASERLADENHFLSRLSDEFDRRFTSLLDDVGMHPDIVALELDPYQVIVVASLIEEEALVAEDRPKIARVIYNRLARGMRLDIDATACYAVNKPCADLTSDDLANPSPWNTRAVAGLPPSPISAPGEASLRAALEPADGDWLFYVLTDSGGVTGAHHFSVTLEEHIANIAICRELGYC